MSDELKAQKEILIKLRYDIGYWIEEYSTHIPPDPHPDDMSLCVDLFEDVVIEIKNLLGAYLDYLKYTLKARQAHTRASDSLELARDNYINLCIANIKEREGENE